MDECAPGRGVYLIADDDLVAISAECRLVPRDNVQSVVMIQIGQFDVVRLAIVNSDLFPTTSYVAWVFRTKSFPP